LNALFHSEMSGQRQKDIYGSQDQHPRSASNGIEG
jgi:hypothetical protein